MSEISFILFLLGFIASTSIVAVYRLGDIRDELRKIRRQGMRS